MASLRKAIAFAKRIEKAERKRANEAARQYKAMLKQQEFENVRKVVNDYNNYIDLLSSIHKDSNEDIDWQEILNEKQPQEPIFSNINQKEAEQKLVNYKPNFWDKLFGLTNKKIKKLETLVEIAKQKDIENLENEKQKYSNLLSEWKRNQDIAQRVLNQDIEAYKEVLEHLNPFSDINEIGSGLSISFEKQYLLIKLNANGVDIIPNFIVSQTSTGKLSKKQMPITKFNELYQDYICGCVLRISREIFAYLPVKYAFINVVSNLLNSSNGHIEEQTILSVMIPRTTLNLLNFETLDPSDSMKNFNHNMSFSKQKGFNTVENLDIEMLINNIQ